MIKATPGGCKRFGAALFYIKWILYKEHVDGGLDLQENMLIRQFQWPKQHDDI